MCNRKFRDHTSELFYNLNCLKLPELISLKSLCVMNKAKNNLFPTKIQKYLVVLNTVHSHNTTVTDMGFGSIRHNTPD